MTCNTQASHLFEQIHNVQSTILHHQMKVLDSYSTPISHWFELIHILQSTILHH